LKDRKTLSDDTVNPWKKGLVEAALYVAGRPLTIKMLAKIAKTSMSKTRKIVNQLAETYRNQNGALELIELDDGRVVLQLKSMYVSSVQRLAMRPLLTIGPLKTLSYIAYRQPILQTDVIEVRGSHAYGHIRDLRNLHLVAANKTGRTYLLRTTSVFADYFSLSHDPRQMKKQLEKMFKALKDQEEPED
jgi:segregation and condensation protein B